MSGVQDNQTQECRPVLPSLIVQCIEYLRKRKDLEGIFRISGDIRRVEELKELFFRAGDDWLDLDCVRYFFVVVFVVVFESFWRPLRRGRKGYLF